MTKKRGVKKLAQNRHREGCFLPQNGPKKTPTRPAQPQTPISDVDLKVDKKKAALQKIRPKHGPKSRCELRSIFPIDRCFGLATTLTTTLNQGPVFVTTLTQSPDYATKLPLDFKRHLLMEKSRCLSKMRKHHCCGMSLRFTTVRTHPREFCSKSSTVFRRGLSISTGASCGFACVPTKSSRCAAVSSHASSISGMSSSVYSSCAL